MIRSLMLVLIACAGLTRADAQELTLFVLDPVEGDPRGLRVVDGEGRVLVLRGELAVQLAAAEGALTVGVRVRRDWIEASYVVGRLTRAVAVEVDGVSTMVPPGPVRLVARSGGSWQLDFVQRRKTGKRVMRTWVRGWVHAPDAQAVTFTPTIPPGTQLRGRIERDAQGRLLVRDAILGRLPVLGPLGPLLDDAVGRAVKAEGVVIRPPHGSGVRLTRIEGTAPDHRSLTVVSGAPDGLTVLVSGRPVVVARSEVRLGWEWATVRGRLATRIEAGVQTWKLVPASGPTVEVAATTYPIRVQGLAPLLGATVELAGGLDPRTGKLVPLELTAVAERDIAGEPPIAAGTLLRVTYLPRHEDAETGHSALVDTGEVREIEVLPAVLRFDLDGAPAQGAGLVGALSGQ